MQNAQSTGNPNVEQQYRTMIVVRFALFVSQLMFLLILFFIKPKIFRSDYSAPLLGENSAIVFIFALLGATVVTLSSF